MAEPWASVVSIVAPPGYGKTILLADWASRERRPVAWLTLDDYDNEPSVLLTYLAAALDRLAPIDPEVGRAIGSSRSRLLATAVPRLAAAVHRIGEPASSCSMTHTGSSIGPASMPSCALIDHLAGRLSDRPGRARRAGPPSREAPCPPGPPRDRHLRARPGRGRDQPASPPQRDVRSRSTRPMSCANGPRDGRRASTSPPSPAPGRSIPARATVMVSGQDPAIADYLRSELLSSLDDEDQTFLTRSSILEVVEPAAGRVRDRHERGCRAPPARWRGTIGSSRPSPAARRPIGSTTSCPSTSGPSSIAGSPGMAPELHRRAASWFERAGRIELAIEHALAGADETTAARLVVAVTLPMHYAGHTDLLDRWIRAFDERTFERLPPLAVVGALVNGLCGRPEAAERLALVAERSTFAGIPGDGSASFESARAILRAAMARRGPDDVLANVRNWPWRPRPTTSPWRPDGALRAWRRAHHARRARLGGRGARRGGRRRRRRRDVPVLRSGDAHVPRDGARGLAGRRATRTREPRGHRRDAPPRRRHRHPRPRRLCPRGDPSRRHCPWPRRARPCPARPPAGVLRAAVDRGRGPRSSSRGPTSRSPTPRAPGSSVAEAEAVVRRRPDLGLLVRAPRRAARPGRRRRELARRTVDAHPRRAPGAAIALDAPHPPGDRGPPVELPQHDPLPRDVDLREARGDRPRRGRRTGDRARPPGAVPGSQAHDRERARTGLTAFASFDRSGRCGGPGIGGSFMQSTRAQRCRTDRARPLSA